MAEKEINKSEEIRKTATHMKEKGESPRPVLIIESLKKQGIVVSSPQVSMVLKKMGFRPRKRRTANAASNVTAQKKPASVVVGRGNLISVEDLILAKKIVGQLGGIDRALAAISALKRFESYLSVKQVIPALPAMQQVSSCKTSGLSKRYAPGTASVGPGCTVLTCPIFGFITLLLACPFVVCGA